MAEILTLNKNNGLCPRKEFYMKKLYTVLAIGLILTSLFSLCVSANTMGSMRDAESNAGSSLDEAVTDIKDAVTGVITDMDEMLDPDNGDPEAESDGIVDDKDTAIDNKDTGKNDDTTNEMPSSTADNRDTDDKRDTTSEDSQNAIDDMNLEEKGINPWAIVIAVIVVIAVLVLIFILIPKRRH